MSILAELRAHDSGFSEDDLDWLHVLVGDWQLIADLSFADLVLWVPKPREDDVDYVVAAQCRPTTGLRSSPRMQWGTVLLPVTVH